MQRPDRNCYAVEVTAVVLFIIVLALAIASCHAQRSPMMAVGPDKSHYSKPKFE